MSNFFHPKLLDTLHGYGRKQFLSDLSAGVTVGIVALLATGHRPVTMDRLFETLGATVVRYPVKTRCCGGSLTGTLPEPGLLCTYILLKEALKRGADVNARNMSNRTPLDFLAFFIDDAFGIVVEQAS